MNFLQIANIICTLDQEHIMESNQVWLAFSFLTFLCITLAIYACIYIFMAFGLFAIARKNEYKRPWLSFIPFVQFALLGKFSRKNKILNKDPYPFAIVLSVLLAIYAVLFILYCVSVSLCLSHLEAQIVQQDGLNFVQKWDVEASFAGGQYGWSAWFIITGWDYIMRVLDLIIWVMLLFLFTSFFKTYYPKHYFLYAVVAVVIPFVSGILVFIVRKNTPVNYWDYIRALREVEYRRYQEFYGRQSANQSQYGDPYRYDHTNSTQQSDPFDEFGGNKTTNRGSSNGQDSASNNDPFEDFN